MAASWFKFLMFINQSMALVIMRPFQFASQIPRIKSRFLVMEIQTTVSFGIKEMESTSHPKRLHSESTDAKWPNKRKAPSIGVIERMYSFEAALADLIDNALQAIWSDGNESRRISIEFSEDSICVFHSGISMDASQENSVVEWGLRSSLKHMSDEEQAIVNPPYLKPFFGKFGYGVAVSSMHLGRCVKICYTSNTFDKVRTFHIERDGLLQSSSAVHIYRMDGGVQETSEEFCESLEGSFTKVHIFEVNMESLHLPKLLCRLKDIYFPYIQVNEVSEPGIAISPIQFQVNGIDLAEIEGGEVSITKLHTCNGPEFVLNMQFVSNPYIVGSSSRTLRKANARLRCAYIPIIQGMENTDRIVEQLASDASIEDNNAGFVCVSVRRLGRLLPDACWARLPFMEPTNKIGDDAHKLKRCYYRVKCFIETDAGFNPTSCKTDLSPIDPYTRALKSFGAELPGTEKGLDVQIYRDGNKLSLQEMKMQFKEWVLRMHNKFDEEIACNDKEAVLVINSPNMKELGFTEDVVRVCKTAWRKGKSWKSGQRIKIWKGASAKFQKTNTYATIEYIIVEGFTGATGGEAQVVCRKIDTPGNMGCLLEKNSDGDYMIDIRQCVTLPIRALDSGKITIVESSQWNKVLEKKHRDHPFLADGVGEGVGDCASPKVEGRLPDEAGQVHDAEVVRPNDIPAGQTLDDEAVRASDISAGQLLEDKIYKYGMRIGQQIMKRDILHQRKSAIELQLFTTQGRIASVVSSHEKEDRDASPLFMRLQQEEEELQLDLRKATDELHSADDIYNKVSTKLANYIEKYNALVE